jgi:caffeoyl-CoA O-methyltransferase
MDKNINIDHEMIEYILSHTKNLHPVQKELIKFNENLGHIKRLQLSILQGNFLQFLIKIKNFKSCLEIGTFTGYSSLSMALALPKNGRVHSIDNNLSKNKIANSFFEKAKMKKKIKTEILDGNIALDRLIKNKKKFDLIFIDADKGNYVSYFNKSLKLLNKNGLIVVDNILWKGDVINDMAKDKLTTQIKNFNDHIKKTNINKYILPVGDGFFICWK